MHIPYCRSKCRYCDFYSVCSLKTMDEYTNAVIKTIHGFGKKYHRKADTLYFGGGTPTLLGNKNLTRIIDAVCECFDLDDQAEITCETNPSAETDSLFPMLRSAGINRLSIGMQSAVGNELEMLARHHTKKDVANCVNSARKAGIDNISLDVMLGIPLQTEKSLDETLRFAESLNPSHISAYILKVEPKTIFFKLQQEGKLDLPDEEKIVGFYMQTTEFLERSGYSQYEISNFSKPGKESRHNLKYWNDTEYLGIGSAAHSFMDGKRFFFQNSIDEFCNLQNPISDGTGGDFFEYAMLRLRLCEGLREDLVFSRFGHPIPKKIRKKAELFEKHGLMQVAADKVAITRKGFLLSNSIIGELL